MKTLTPPSSLMWRISIIQQRFAQLSQRTATCKSFIFTSFIIKPLFQTQCSILKTIESQFFYYINILNNWERVTRIIATIAKVCNKGENKLWETLPTHED